MRESDLAVLADKQKSVLELVSVGIQRSKKRNATWLSGGSIAVHAVEWVLSLSECYVNGDQEGFDRLMNKEDRRDG